MLIVTLPSRHEFLGQLLAILEPQVIALGVRKFDQVDIRISASDIDLPVGDRREALRQRATGEYICFLDDDDLVSPNYIARIMPLLDGVDQVGFEVEGWNDHTKMLPTYHSLKYGKWTNPVNGRMGLEGAYCRDISHLNPMRRELALRAPIAGGFGEDCRWANELRALDVVKTEHYIDEVMYYYLWRGGKNDARDAIDPWRLAFIERLYPKVTA